MTKPGPLHHRKHEPASFRAKAGWRCIPYNVKITGIAVLFVLAVFSYDCRAQRRDGEAVTYPDHPNIILYIHE